MSERTVTLGELAGALLIAVYAGVRALIVLSGLQWTKAGRRIYR